ncbi:hypothetical protein Ddc_11539 [Ditylenchus destructor]|nr:hypothetical protein Ddc_11539 [Ditylenchus destructor]
MSALRSALQRRVLNARILNGILRCLRRQNAFNTFYIYRIVHTSAKNGEFGSASRSAQNYYHPLDDVFDDIFSDDSVFDVMGDTYHQNRTRQGFGNRTVGRPRFHKLEDDVSELIRAQKQHTAPAVDKKTVRRIPSSEKSEVGSEKYIERVSNSFQDDLFELIRAQKQNTAPAVDKKTDDFFELISGQKQNTAPAVDKKTDDFFELISGQKQNTAPVVDKKTVRRIPSPEKSEDDLIELISAQKQNTAPAVDKKTFRRIPSPEKSEDDLIELISAQKQNTAPAVDKKTVRRIPSFEKSEALTALNSGPHLIEGTTLDVRKAREMAASLKEEESDSKSKD